MIQYFLKNYLQEKPIFLSLIRAKEAELYQRYLPLKKPILDVGCGDGFFAKVTFGKSHPDRSEGSPSGFFSRFYRDQNDKMKIIDIGLDVENSRIEEAGKLGIYKKLIIYDGKRIPFGDNSFATVISNCVLEHIPNLELTLREISRVLKQGGLFLTTVVAIPWEEYFLGNLLLGDWYKKWMRKKQKHFNMYSEIVWKQIFTKCRYKIIDEVGYLDKTAVRFIDLFHYISLPNLITYKLFGKWVIWKGIANILPINLLSRIIDEEVPPSKSGNIFFALKK